MSSVLDLSSVSVVRNGNTILHDVDWRVTGDQRWVILGPNGAGKTTLLQLASSFLFPTTGTVELLGNRLGRVDVFEMRSRVGLASTAMSRRIPESETVLDVVLTAAYAVTGRWNETYEDIDVKRAHRVLAEWKLDGLAERRFGSLSDGEQKRVQIARSVMTDPELLLLDEPAASLDLGAREELVGLLSGFARADDSPAIVMVTHHVRAAARVRQDRRKRPARGGTDVRDPVGDVRARDRARGARRPLRRPVRLTRLGAQTLARPEIC
jgi:iron complex transport system ATP-binding protein